MTTIPNKKIIKSHQLINSLNDAQQRYLPAFQWISRAGKGSGRTHLLCVVALLDALELGEGFVIDHTPFIQWHSYVRDLIFSIASHVDMKIRVTHIQGNTYRVELSDKNEYRERK